MGSSSSTSIFLILLVSAIVHLLPPSSHLFVSGDSSLIRNTCKSTNNYKLCVTSLRSNSSSLKADRKGLAAIIIRIAMTHANQTNSFLSSQLLSSSTSSDPLVKKVVKDCADEYSHATEALQGSLQDLDSMSFDYAYVQLTAAKDYPNACHNGYKRFTGLAYPVELARREAQLEHLCGVALGIVDHLGY